MQGEGTESQQALQQRPPMSEEQKAEEYKKFEEIIYSNLDRVLEKRPGFPVTKFAKAILEDVNLDERGEPIQKKKKRKDKKKKKDRGEDSEEAKHDEGETTEQNPSRLTAARESAQEE